MPQFLGLNPLVTMLFLFGAGCTDFSVNKSNEDPSNNASLFSELNVPTHSITPVLPGYVLAFPRDHASHPKFAIEWWYVTANLQDDEGNAYALQWTLFRLANGNQITPWSNGQQFMGHVALKTQGKSWFEERFARGAVGNAGVSTSPFNAFLDNWQWIAKSEQLFPSQLELTIQNQVAAQLKLDADKPFILHGDQGFSRKLRNSQQASYYYSQPHIQVSGEIQLPGKAVKVSGNAWYDHEWTSEYLTDGAMGWDWFSIHFDSGAKLMLFRMRHQQHESFWSGSLVTENQEKIHLEEQDIEGLVLKKEMLEGKLLPLNWSIKIPAHAIDITVSPMQKRQWNAGLFSYYEGGTVISGSHSGVGFIELTGYN